jgi:hypothetical protein
MVSEIRITQINNNMKLMMELKTLHKYKGKDRFRNIDFDINMNILYSNYKNSFNIINFDKKSAKSQVINYNLDEHGSFAFDWIYNYLFFTDHYNIIITKLNETNIFYLISNKTTTRDYYVTDICVNPIDLFVIWSEDDGTTDSGAYIYKAKYDGSSKISLVTKNILEPISMVIDFTIKRIYYIDDSLNLLVSIDYDGNDRKNIHSSDKSMRSSRNIDIYNGFIYWADFNIGSKKIHKINSNGEELSQIEMPENFNRAFKIIHSSRQPNAINLCADTKCSHLCLPINFASYRCKCPEVEVYNLTENCVEYV